MKSLFIALTLTCTLLSAGSIGLAADKSSSSATAEKKTRHMPFRGTVSAIDKSAMTLTLDGKEKARTFLLSSRTRIQKDGNPAVIDDIKVGEAVGGQAAEAAGGQWEVTTLNLGKKAASSKTGGASSSKKPVGEAPSMQ